MGLGLGVVFVAQVSSLVYDKGLMTVLTSPRIPLVARNVPPRPCHICWNRQNRHTCCIIHAIKTWPNPPTSNRPLRHYCYFLPSHPWNPTNSIRPGRLNLLIQTRYPTSSTHRERPVRPSRSRTSTGPKSSLSLVETWDIPIRSSRLSPPRPCSTVASPIYCELGWRGVRCTSFLAVPAP